MFGSAAFSEAIHHEILRIKPNAGIIADVYDTPAWKRMMGDVTNDDLKRIGILFCIDGIPAFNYKVSDDDLMMLYLSMTT